MDRGVQAGLINGEDGVGAACSVSAGASELAGVNQQGLTDISNHGLMGMPKDDAVHICEKIIHSTFNVNPVAGPVTDADAIAAQHNLSGFRQGRAGRAAAAVTADRINLFALENRQYWQLGNISGMNYDPAVRKCPADVIPKLFGDAV